jgi:hypothetical protein
LGQRHGEKGEKGEGGKKVASALRFEVVHEPEKSGADPGDLVQQRLNVFLGQEFQLNACKKLRFDLMKRAS